LVEAAARAYLQAANKAAYEMKRLAEASDVATQPVHSNKLTDRFFPGGY
jgi:hypothetical protein